MPWVMAPNGEWSINPFATHLNLDQDEQATPAGLDWSNHL